MWGRITPSLALHTGASDTVSDTAVAVGAVQRTRGAEKLILKVDYTKGAEDGLNIWVMYPRTLTDAVLYRTGGWEEAGAGVNLYYPVIFSTLATAAMDIEIDLGRNAFYQVYQQRSGTTGADGTFTLYHETHGKRIDGGGGG